MEFMRVRHVAALLSGGSIAIILALISAVTVFAGGEGIHYP